MTLPRHLDGDLPGTLIRFCSVRSEAIALGRRNIRRVEWREYWDAFALEPQNLDVLEPGPAPISLSWAIRD